MKRFVVGLVACLFSIASQAEVSMSVGKTTLYRSTQTVAVYDTQEECRAAALANAKKYEDVKFSGTTAYGCRTSLTATYSAPAPSPVDCVVGEFSDWSPQTCYAPDAQTRTRIVTTEPANDGTACPVLSETQTCPVAPLPPAGTTTTWINVGGPAVGDYVADAYFNGGSTSTNCQNPGTGVYASRRYSDSSFSYSIPVSNGSYFVKIITRECWNSASGLRRQSAVIEGSAIGTYATYTSADDGVKIKAATVNVADGTVNITMTAALGDVILNAIEIRPADGTTNPPPVQTGSVTLLWEPPTQNTDGSALTDLAGYKIFWGTVDSLNNVVDLQNASLVSFVLDGIPVGSRSFKIRAYNAAGTESEDSNIVSKLVN